MLTFVAFLAIGSMMVGSSTQAPVGTELCLVPVDVVLVLDASSSIGTKQYSQELQFAANLTRKFQLGTDFAQFGAIVFSYSVVKLFDLKDNSDQQSLTEALLAAPYQNSSTYTQKALRFIDYDGMFDTDAGGRDNAADIVILITDGKSNRPSETLSAANKLKAQNVTIIAVGIGDDVSDEELEDLASSPDKVFKAASFDVLDSIKSQVAERTCAVSESQTKDSEEDKGEDGSTGNTGKDESLCLIPADIVLVLDASSSIGTYYYAKELQFAANLTTKFQLGSLSTRFAALVFSYSAQKLFDLGDYADSQSLISALLAAPYQNSSTYTQKALRFIDYDGMFDTDAGGRDNAADIVILITDGKSNRLSETISAAKTLKDQNVTIITVGIGNDVSEDELQTIASSPQDVFRAEGFDVLDSIREKIAQRACHVAQGGGSENSTADNGNDDDDDDDDDGGDQNSNGECVADTDEGCQNLSNGDYPACYPQCQDGIYISCSNGYRYVRDCGLGWYESTDGTLFTAKLVYDPELKSCERKTDYCPRPLDEQILA